MTQVPAADAATGSTTAAPSSIDELPSLDVFGERYRSDPLAVLREARASHWAARSARGLEVLTYEMCERALLDDRFHHGARKLMEFLGPDAIETLAGPGRTLVGSEGDDHVAMRRVVGRWFTPRRVSNLRGATRELVDGLLERVAPAGRCEFVEDVANRLPGVVFCWMVGAPPSDGDRLAEWSNTVLKAFRLDPDDAEEIRAASGELTAYVEQLMESKRREPGDDVTSFLLAAVDDGTVTVDDVKSLLNEMLSASTDNTAQSATLMLWLLATDPDQWDRLGADRSLVPNAVEECARFEPRVPVLTLHNPDDADLGGIHVPGGTLTWLNVTIAHRDPAVFDDPDRFDVTRVLPKHQLNFGTGRHYCLGAALARMELQVVLEALLDHWDRPRLDGEAHPDRGISGGVPSLPVAFGALRPSPQWRPV